MSVVVAVSRAVRTVSDTVSVTLRDVYSGHGILSEGVRSADDGEYGNVHQAAMGGQVSIGHWTNVLSLSGVTVGSRDNDS